MVPSKYNYNDKTLRYEPARISWLNVFGTSLGLLSFGFLFFIGLVWVQNFLTETPTEKALRAENRALNDYKLQLSVQLASATSELSELQQKDESLYEKIFEVKKQESTASEEAVSKEILLAESPAFGSLMTSLLSKAETLSEKVSLRNNYFGESASVKKSDISRLASAPSFPPVPNFDATRLVSGYGIRINPFHKGKYHHDGIDISAPRDSEVLAAAPGIVSAVSYSDLQAGFGNYVEVEHGDGYMTRYANLGSISVRYGQRLTKGQTIGVIGISGGSVAPHVHYEVIRNGKNLNPIRFLMHGLTPDQYAEIALAGSRQNQSLD